MKDFSEFNPKNPHNWATFTPGHPVVMDSIGRQVQVIDGKVHVLSPATARRVLEYQSVGFSDEEIETWLSVT